ncbi:transcription elongation factor [Christiangramia echinicola]|uniref:transcription elongation factor n=1 Tax=Christiangramia echinicola TaxID=279359 RepID=UPI000414DD3E|nr:transcription elongation factor [Christiangramia echinicola]
MAAIRSELIRACRDYLQTKILVVRKAMDSLKEDMENESKSSAGDKFETGREMINIEWNKLSVQLNEYDRLGQILNRIEEHKPNGNIILGSMVITDAAKYFISIPAGEIKSNDEKYYAVGIKAPIAQILLGKKVGDNITFNGRECIIEDII